METTVEDLQGTATTAPTSVGGGPGHFGQSYTKYYPLIRKIRDREEVQLFSKSLELHGIYLEAVAGIIIRLAKEFIFLHKQYSS